MTQGGPAQPVVTSTDPPMAGPAVRVAVVSDGRPTLAGPAMRVVEVTDGRPVAAGPAIPIVVATGNQASQVQAGPPIPVYVVSGSLGPGTLAYTNKVKALGPIAYFPLADASGTTAADESGNGRNGTYSNVTLGATGIGDGRTAAAFNGSTSYANIYTAGLAGAFNGAEGSAAIWMKASAAGIWTDGAFHEILRLRINASNAVIIEKTSTNGQIRFTYLAGGVLRTINDISLSGSVAYAHLALTWSAAADQVKAFVNGVQTGSTQTGLGVWSGSLVSTTTVIGANDTTPTFVWSGSLAHAAIFSSALPPAQIASLASV